ncbi:MAG: hypothetical protein M1378_02485 [Bacteroidetes bacterium]|nr:hypothetical protein [Bacteroidota bacterium]
MTSLSSLTPPSELGQENGDSTDLDDFDDYNGLNDNGLIQCDTLSTGIYYARTRVST